MEHTPGHRDPADAWVTGPGQTRYWGRYGAAGLVLYWPKRGVLLQHRAAWSHHGGTWGIPGGALHTGESAQDAALREAREEAGVDSGMLTVVDRTVYDLGFWSYTTLIAVTHAMRLSEPTDHESVELRWVALDDVASFDLHPGFRDSWPQVKDRLDRL